MKWLPFVMKIVCNINDGYFGSPLEAKISKQSGSQIARNCYVYAPPLLKHYTLNRYVAHHWIYFIMEEW